MVLIMWLEQQALRFVVDQQGLFWSLARWGGKCSVWQADPWRALWARARETPPRGAQKQVTGVTLLSAEHTEFTWNQKAWEDKLIQVTQPAEAGVGDGGGLAGGTR